MLPRTVPARGAARSWAMTAATAASMPRWLSLVVASYWLLVQIHRLRGQLHPPDTFSGDHAAVTARRAPAVVF
jgi:hypothetical protein